MDSVSYRLAAFLMIKVTFIDFQVEFYSAANIDIFPTLIISNAGLGTEAEKVEILSPFFFSTPRNSLVIPKLAQSETLGDCVKILIFAS